MFGQARGDPCRPLWRCCSDACVVGVAKRPRGDEGDQFIVLVVEYGGFYLRELRLQDVLDGLDLDTVSAHLELRVDAAKEVHAMRTRIDTALVACAVEAPEAWMRDEFLRRLHGQITVAARNMNAANAKFSCLTVRQWIEFARFKYDVGDVGQGATDGDRLSGSQTLATRVRARFRWTVGIDDLAPATRPRLNQSGGKSFAGRHDVAAQGIGQVQLRGGRQRAQQHRGAEQHRDLCFSKNAQQIRAGSQLLPGQQNHSATGHPGAVHLGNAAVVTQRGGERCRIHARDKIEVIGVAQGQVHVAGMRAFNALGHAGRSARVEDGCQALRRIIQPPWRWASRACLGQSQDIKRWQAAKIALALGEHDNRPCVLKYVGEQCFGQGGVEKQHGPASLENAKVRGDDRPVVLGHGDGHHLIGPGEEGTHGGSQSFGAHVELRECQRLTAVGDLQGRVMRKAPGRAAEDFGQPLNVFLLRNARKVAVSKDLSQAERTGVMLSLPRFTGHPAVAFPRGKSETEAEHGNGRQHRA